MDQSQRNQFRNADLYFIPGEREGTTDLQLNIKDRFPIQIYGGGDNTGNDATGNARWFGGATWGECVFFNYPKIRDELIFLVFFDYGLGNVNDRSKSGDLITFNPKIPVTQYLMSVGPGVRYYINSNLSLRVDWGIKLHRTIFSDSAQK